MDIQKINETMNSLDLLKNHIIVLDNLKKAEPQAKDPVDYYVDREVKDEEGEVTIEKVLITPVKPHAQWEAKVEDFNKAIEFHSNAVETQIADVLEVINKEIL